MIVRSTALALPLRDGCVDLVVTSPPYFALRSYRDDGEHYGGQVGAEETPAAFVEALLAATAEMVRVLKPEGSIFVNLGDKYAGSGGHNNNGLGKSGLINSKKYLDGRADQGSQAKVTRRDAPDRYNQNSGGIRSKSLMGLPWRYALGCIDQLGLILRAEIIWSKPNGMPESATDRVRRSHEQWFHFVKQGQYFSAVDEIREPYTASSIERAQYGPSTHPGRATIPGEKRTEFQPWAPDIALGRLPGSVWTIPLEPLIVPDWAADKYNLPDHFAAFPQEWPRRLILGWSPANGVVLDPFGGTGTVAMVARALGRTGLNGDLSGDYCRLARWRIYESGHAAKSEDRTWRDAQGAML